MLVLVFASILFRFNLGTQTLLANVTTFMKYTNRIKNSDLKIISAYSTSKGAAGLVVFAAMLVGCGQKGALYLPSGSSSHTANATQHAHTSSDPQNHTQNSSQHNAQNTDTNATQHAQQATEDNADF